MVIDEAAYRFLPSEIMEMNKKGASGAYPLLTSGDGNCLPRAVSRFMWGTEYWHTMLRRALVQEMRDNEAFYKEYLGQYEIAGVVDKYDVEDSEWERVMHEAKSEGGHDGMLQSVHIFALCHVIRRPIMLLCSDETRVQLGEGAAGVAGTYIPVRFKPEECSSKEPVVVAWAGEVLHHFVPVVGMENKLSPVWPVMPAAWKSFEALLDKYMARPQGDKRLRKEDNEVLMAMVSALKKQEEMDAFQEGPKVVMVNKQRKFKHPKTGLVYDKMLQVAERYFCGLNLGEDPKEVIARFYKEHPSMLEDPDELPLRKKFETMVNVVLAGRVDGETSGSEGPAGPRHWLDQEEVDMMVEVSDNVYLGWNWGDDLFVVVDKFMTENLVKAAAALGARFELFQSAVVAERRVIAMRYVKDEMAKERAGGPRKTAICSKCNSSVEFGRFDISVTCTTCGEESLTGKGTKVVGCVSCSGPIPIVDGQRFAQCRMCERVYLMLKCPKCNAQTCGEASSLRTHAECPQCSHEMVTGFPRFTFREPDASKRLIPTMSLKPYLADRATRMKVIDAITKANEAMGFAPCLDDMDLVNLQQLAGVLDDDNMERVAFDPHVGPLLDKLLLSPNGAVRFPALDLLRILLLNTKYVDSCLQAPLVLVKKINKAGWEGDSDWKCKFNGLKSINNLICGALAQGNEPLVETLFDLVLGCVGNSFGETSKEWEMQGAATVALNISTMFAPARPRQGSVDSCEQFLVCLLMSAFPKVMELRRSLFRSVINNAPNQKDVLAKIAQVDSALVMLLQSFSNIFMGQSSPALDGVMRSFNAQNVLRDLVNDDGLVCNAFTSPDSIPKPTQLVRNLLREIIGALSK